MNWKRKQLYDSQLYAVLDKQVLAGKQASKVALKMARAGIKVFQLRDKLADTPTFLEEVVSLKAALRGKKAVCIVNDRIDVCLAAKADGVHLGQQDMPLAYARKILGRDKIIGISCMTITEALLAQRGGADYIGIGPCFLTSTKPGVKTIKRTVLRDCVRKIRIPVFAIGGIRANNVHELARCGIKKIAASGSFCRTTDLYRIISTFKEAL
ncbi:MAG: thiamine phosphate synthase [Candidatus Omnitrophica bacterium]|nr:thiamine phosphate synthase [Candidatus Omnitrophota bacterium]